MTDDELIMALQDAFWWQAEQLMLHHTNPWELDEALEDVGYGAGPCLAQDHIGLDKVLARRAGRVGPVLPRMVAEGRLGKIGGVGFYRYPGGGGAVIDPLIEDLIREEAWFAKVERFELEPTALVAQMNDALAQTCRALPTQTNWADTLAQAVHFPTHKIAELGL